MFLLPVVPSCFKYSSSCTNPSISVIFLLSIFRGTALWRPLFPNDVNQMHSITKSASALSTPPQTPETDIYAGSFLLPLKFTQFAVLFELCPITVPCSRCCWREFCVVEVTQTLQVVLVQVYAKNANISYE